MKLLYTSKVFFLSFADSRSKSALFRIKQQAEAFEVFDKIILFSESQLNTTNYPNIKKNLNKKNRGFGFYAWKPLFIKKIMDEMNFGDALVYCDAGVHLNIKGKNKLYDYINLLNEKNPFLLFRDQPINDGCLIFRDDMGWTNAKYIKMETLAFYNLEKNEIFLNSNQVAAGIFLLKKTYFTSFLIGKWLEDIESNFELVNDDLDESKQRSDFLDHRHDQAVINCLIYPYHDRVIFRSFYEVFSPVKVNINLLEAYPFHSLRDIKTNGLINRTFLKVRKLFK